jgi:hypothetical protein
METRIRINQAAAWLLIITALGTSGYVLVEGQTWLDSL